MAEAQPACNYAPPRRRPRTVDVPAASAPPEPAMPKTILTVVLVIVLIALLARMAVMGLAAAFVAGLLWLMHGHKFTR